MTTLRYIAVACLLPISALADVPEGSSPELRRTVRAYASHMVQCFGKAHKKDPDARGYVTLSFDIVDQELESVQTIADTVGIAKLSKCMKRRARGWVYETVEDGTYTWQFDFRVGTDTRED